MDQPPQSTGSSQPPIRPLLVPEPSAVPPPRKSRIFVRLLLALLLLGLIGSLVLNAVLMAIVGFTGIGSADGEGRVQKNFLA